jgi:hypothetical protein
MKFIQVTIFALFLIALSFPAKAQRDANTSSARAAYSVPTSPSFQKSKKKNKKKKVKAARKARKQNSEASVLRKRPIL